VAAVALALLSAVGCAPEHVAQGRPYALHVPPGSDGRQPLPLVVLLHGYGANGHLQDLFFPLRRHVEERGWLYAVPHGTVDRAGRRFWNATDACCNTWDVPVDDVAFLRAVVEDVARVHPVAPGRVFLVGHSNGGFMGLRMACDASDLVAGVVSVAGAAQEDAARCPAGAPVSVLQVHGSEDATILFEGGETDRARYPSARATTDLFARRNGCQDDGPVEGAPLDLVGDVATETRRLEYPGCPGSGAVELWRVEGAGHLPAFNEAWGAHVLDWLEEHAR
jgi:polyhydroxybutyrate depolymerase